MYKDETEAMLSIQPMLHRLANLYASKYHLNKEELFQEMQLPALHAVRTHDATRRTLVSWVVLVVSRKINSRVRHPGFRSLYQVKSQVPVPEITSRRFDLQRLLFEVSEDAAQAIELAISEGIPDPEYIEVMLYIGMGWTQSHIRKIFQEVRNALVA